METKIKICGLRSEADIGYINETKPDYCGFILNVPGSRRNISPEKAGQLIKYLDSSVVAVGVFVDEVPEKVIEIARKTGIGMIQLHGQESEEQIRIIQEQTGLPVIKAFSVKSPEDIKRAEKSPADYILFDCGSGGTGQTFEWSYLEGQNRNYFLAGGIGADNMEEAVRRFAPYAIDLSSSVETDGVKDGKKIADAVKQLRSLTLT